jgi:hypothetical protein
MPMDLRTAATIALGRPDAALGNTSKMPGYSFGLSAFKCKRGSALAKDPRTACGQCYARTNYYATKHEVVKAHRSRMAGLAHPDWIEAMATLIGHYVTAEVPYFRWHDSGDIQSWRHLADIAEVCRRTPGVHHWLPTHEPHMVKRYMLRVSDDMEPPHPQNLVIRISGDDIDKPPDAGMAQYWPTSTIHRGHGNRQLPRVTLPGVKSIECKSYTRSKSGRDSGQCGKCRACWDPRVANVSFPLHGERKGKYQLKLVD